MNGCLTNSGIIFLLIYLRYYSMTNFDDRNNQDLAACLEALLFVASGPITKEQLAATLEVSIKEVDDELNQLGERYKTSGGLSLQWSSGKVQLTTSPKLGKLIERYLSIENISRLSKAALETLAVISYQQPVTRPQIDIIRGVNSDGVLKNLLFKGLIQEMGRAETPGRPIMYSTTTEFLQYFGLSSIKDLPPLEDIPNQPVKSNTESIVLKD
jgi:segregation and condensation protein B